MWVPYLLRSPERSSYSNGPKTTLGAGFGWVPIAGLRSYHNTLRFNEFRVEVRFKAKCMDWRSGLGYSCPACTQCSHERKYRYEDHHEKRRLSADGGDTFDGGARRPGGGCRKARAFQRFATSTGVHHIPGGRDTLGRWDRRGNRHAPWSIYADLALYGEPRGRHGIRARSLYWGEWRRNLYDCCRDQRADRHSGCISYYRDPNDRRWHGAVRGRQRELHSGALDGPEYWLHLRFVPRHNNFPGFSALRPSSAIAEKRRRERVSEEHSGST